MPYVALMSAHYPGVDLTRYLFGGQDYRRTAFIDQFRRHAEDDRRILGLRDGSTALFLDLRERVSAVVAHPRQHDPEHVRRIEVFEGRPAEQLDGGVPEERRVFRRRNDRRLA